MKITLLLFLLFLTTEPYFSAQSTATDSALVKTKTATADAKYFKLDKEVWKKYKKHQVSYTSDYFKPNITNNSHPDLLTDSIYVKAYRTAALKKTQQQYGTARFRLIGGIYSGVVFAVVAFTFLAFTSSGKLK